MLPDNREELRVYRLEMARERLSSSNVLLDVENYKDSIGRSYYASASWSACPLIRAAYRM